MRKPRPLSDNLQRVLGVIDDEPVEQYAVYRRLGQAQSIGCYLAALEKRKLIERTDKGHWRRSAKP